MAYAPGFDFAVHWVEKRGQYRMRFMWYRAGLIYSWYQYIPRAVSLEIFQSREPIRTVALGFLYALWPVMILYHLIFQKDFTKYFHYLMGGIWLIVLGIIALAFFLMPLLLLLGWLE